MGATEVRGARAVAVRVAVAGLVGAEVRRGRRGPVRVTVARVEVVVRVAMVGPVALVVLVARVVRAVQVVKGAGQAAGKCPSAARFLLRGAGTAQSHCRCNIQTRHPARVTARSRRTSRALRERTLAKIAPLARS